MRCQQRLLFFLIGLVITSKSPLPSDTLDRCDARHTTPQGPIHLSKLAPPSSTRIQIAGVKHRNRQRSTNGTKNACFSNVNHHSPGVNYSVACFNHPLAMPAEKAVPAQEQEIKKNHLYYVTRFWKVLPIIGVVTMVTNAVNSWGDRGQIVVFTIP